MGEVFQTSRLPGARHPLPKGAKCDVHQDRDAVENIQGETDSFGCETHFCCQECVDEDRKYANSEEARTGMCDWCKTEAKTLANTRDYDEGMSGPVYRVCAPCRKKVDDEARRELEENGDDDSVGGDYDGDYDYDDYAEGK